MSRNGCGTGRGWAHRAIKKEAFANAFCISAVSERIRSASLPELEGWTEHVLNAASIEDLLK